MKRLLAVLVLSIVFFNVTTAYGGVTWNQVGNDLLPKGKLTPRTTQYLVFSTDEVALKSMLFRLSGNPKNADVLVLPMPDGSVKSFKVWQASMMPDELSTKYPELKTFTAVCVDNPNVTAKLDYTLYGFHAMVFNGDEVSFIDPYNNTVNGYYMVHYKKDEVMKTDDRSNCLIKTDGSGREEQLIKLARKSAAKTVNGTQLRTYRLALAANHQYSQAATGNIHPTIAQVLSKMTTSMNRINGIFEREMSITMVFVAKEDTLIWTESAGGVNGNDTLGLDAYNSDATLCNPVNQFVCDSRIGIPNFDIGHAFTTGAGGYSQVGAVCQTPYKAQSSTGQPHPVGDGFDIDFVIHEMGHEFGAEHTFNNGSDNECGKFNRNQPTAYEPGSGSTIMAYAGICSPDNLQPHSDAYFHGISLMEIEDYLTTSIGSTCGVKAPTGNAPASVPSFSRTYAIPYLTPFELTAPAITDTAGDTSVTYCWEQWNLSDYGERLYDTKEAGPIFRSYSPSKSPTRVFPIIDSVLVGVLSNAGNNNAEGEKVPDVARFLTFKLTVRDIFQGKGAFIIPDDTIFLDAINTGAGFVVTSQNTTGLILKGNSTQEITWNKVGTDQIPVKTPNVDIYMSADGGYTWPYHIGNYINNGSAQVTLPNPDTTITKARIKVKGAENVFFNVNSTNFSVVHSDVGDTAIEIRPVPTHSILRVSSGNKGLLYMSVFNAVGQQIWKGEVNGELDLPVINWARGDYIIRFIDAKKQRTVKKFVVD